MLQANDALGGTLFGASVSLSFDGTVALVGAPAAHSPAIYAGAAYSFIFSGMYV